MSEFPVKGRDAIFPEFPLGKFRSMLNMATLKLSSEFDLIHDDVGKMRERGEFLRARLARLPVEDTKSAEIVAVSRAKRGSSIIAKSSCPYERVIFGHFMHRRV